MTEVAPGHVATRQSGQSIPALYHPSYRSRRDFDYWSRS